jgi:uncharacterized membrane protein
VSGRGMVTASTVAAGVGAGLVGGTLFAFSSLVMPALRRLPPAEGVAVMQEINRRAVNPAFMAVLFGTAALSIGIGTHAALHRDDPHATWAGAGAVSYLATIAVTAGFHVPRNDRLATLEGSTVEAARYWNEYCAQWTTGNHVRTLAAGTAAFAFTMAARSLA